MCNPMALGIAGLVGSLASTGASMYMQNKAVKEQNALNAQWRQWQQQQRAAENVRQDELRQPASSSREEGLAKLTGAEQQKAQREEGTRLNETLTENTLVNANPGDLLLSGQQSG